ncbi:MAG: glycosyltransferase family 2 protein [Pirellulales bacterium]
MLEPTLEVHPADSTAPASGTRPAPHVTVIMPVFNEEAFIARSLEGVLAQDYPAELIEIIVADGRSTDTTRDIVRRYQATHPRIQLIENPARFRAAALNLAIPLASGEVVICVDGHCEVAPDFVRQGVQLLDEHPEAWSVGGPTSHVGQNTFAKATAIAMSRRAGVGLAAHRFSDFEGYGEGAQFPAFRRWIFDRVGLFDESMVRTEDDELAFRIRQAGGKVFLSPRVRFQYFVRDSIGKLFQQYSQYGFWRIPMLRKHKRPTTVRQTVPLLFFVLMLVLAVVGLVLGQPLVAAALPIAYLAVVFAVGLAAIPQAGFKVACLVPVAILTMHTAYALGMAYGLFAMVTWPKAFDPEGPMSQQRR